MAFNANDDGAGDWFDQNTPVSTAPANTAAGPTAPAAGPWAGGYVPNYPDPDPTTPGNQNPTMPQNPSLAAPAAAPAASGPNAWIDAALQQAQSTDDPNYWYGVVANDPKAMSGDPSAIAYWQGRIAQGDGALAVRNGTTQKFQDGSSSTGSGVDASLLQPFTQTFSYAPFTAPTGVNDQNDPGYTARLQASNDALQRSAAAKGTLLTGQTLKDLDTNSQTYASNEYGNLYNQQAQAYNTNESNAYNQYLGTESTFYANQNNPFAKLLSQETLNSQNTNAANQVNLGYAGLNSSNTNAQNQLGLGYASLYGNTLTNGANIYGNYLTGGANANAAGTIAGGNAYSNLFGSQIPTTALGLYYGSQIGKAAQPSFNIT